MLLDLTAQFKNTDGTVLSGNTMAKLLSDLLSGQTPGIPAVKAYDWAVLLYKNGEIEIDRTDLDLLEKCVEQNQQIGNLVKAQLITSMKAATAKADTA